MATNIGKAILAATAAALVLLGVYFGALSFVSGWDFTVEQFLTYRYFVIALAAGLWVQVELFMHPRALVQGARRQAARGGGLADRFSFYRSPAHQGERDA